MLLSLLLCGGLVACGDRAPGSMGASSAATTVAGIHEALVLPSDLALTPAYVVFTDDDPEAAVKVISRRTGELVFRAGRRGDGPGEFRFAAGVQAWQDPGDKLRIAAFDRTLRRMTFIEWNPSLRTDTAVVASLKGGVGPLVAELTAEGQTVGAGGFSTDRFQVFDATGAFVSGRGVLPSFGDSLPREVVQQVLQPQLATDSTGRLIALGARYSGQLDLFRISDGARVGRFAPSPLTEAPRIRSNGAIALMVQDQDTRFGFIDLSATDSRIYALYSGRTRREYPGRAHAANTVYVLDWEGVARDSFALPGDATSIEVDDEAGELFFLNVDSVVTLQRLPVPHDAMAVSE